MYPLSLLLFLPLSLVQINVSPPEESQGKLGVSQNKPGVGFFDHFMLVVAEFDLHEARTTRHHNIPHVRQRLELCGPLEYGRFLPYVRVRQRIMRAVGLLACWVNPCVSGHLLFLLCWTLFRGRNLPVAASLETDDGIVSEEDGADDGEGDGEKTSGAIFARVRDVRDTLDRRRLNSRRVMTGEAAGAMDLVLRLRLRATWTWR